MSVDLCKVPAGQPPEGTMSNFENPTTLIPAFMSMTGITVAIGIIVTVARIHTNFRKLTLADYFALVALLMSISILGVEASHLRTARHIWDVPACYFDASFAQGVYFPAILFQMGAFFAKASIFLLFSQLFTVQRSMYIAIRVGLMLNFLIYWPGVAIATYYEVPHVGETWLDTLDGRTLIPLSWWQAQSALIVALDIYIFILPLPTVMRLQMPIRKRLSVISVFSVAMIGIAASIASLVERVIITNTEDSTWIAAILALCSSLELNAAIIVSSMPAFANFARSHILEISNIKSFISSLTSYPGKTKNSASTLDSGSADKLSYGGGEAAKYVRNQRYYEIDEAYVLQNGVLVDEGRHVWVPLPPGVPVEGAIVRTMAFEQTISSSAV